jgi:D-alanyl-D-alanine carboxypeptidase (penicillin-binding protein 5/6)
MSLKRILLLVLFTALMPAAVQAEDIPPPGLTLRSYLIYCVDEDYIVGTYNRDNQQPVASLTKLMTSVLACENLRFDGRYILTDSEAEVFSTETMRVQKLLQLMLVPSNNTACSIIARLVMKGGADYESRFADRMTERARDFGMMNTKFANASGLPGGEQYSTMDDLLRLTLHAMQYPRIREAMSRYDVEINGETYNGTLARLYDRHVGALLGGKTGYTHAAGRCLILLYNANQHNYIVITLGSKGVKDGFRDAEIVLSHYGLLSGEVGEWE